MVISASSSPVVQWVIDSPVPGRVRSAHDGGFGERIAAGDGELALELFIAVWSLRDFCL